MYGIDCSNGKATEIKRKLCNLENDFRFLCVISCGLIWRFSRVACQKLPRHTFLPLLSLDCAEMRNIFF